MTVGIMLSFGESLSTLKRHGQDVRFVNYYLKPYSKNFDKIFVFDWKDESYPMPENVILVPNRYHIPKYLYAFLLPLIEREAFRQCRVLRLSQFTAIMPAAIAKIMWRTKIVSTFGFDYSTFLKIDKKYLKSWLIKLQQKLLFCYVDKFIVTIQSIAKYLEKQGVDAGRIELIPNGVDIEQFKPLTAKIFDHENIKILFVGRLEKQKNLENLLSALHKSKYAKYFEVTFIGRGSLETELYEQAKNLKINLNIIPPVAHLDLPHYYQNADIFMLVSHIEGHPKVLIEAMACGLPCLVSNYPGHEDIVSNHENAYITEVDAQSISKSLDTLIEHSDLRANIATGARKFAALHFDIAIFLDKEIKMIQEL